LIDLSSIKHIPLSPRQSSLYTLLISSNYLYFTPFWLIF
jgi:hypothetical protein